MKNDRMQFRWPREPIKSSKTFRRSGKERGDPLEGYKKGTNFQGLYASGLLESSPTLGKPPTGFYEHDDGKFTHCHTERNLLIHRFLIRGRNNSRSPLIAVVQMACSKLSDLDGSKMVNVNRLWLEVGEPYSNFSEHDSTAAINSAGPEVSRRVENWNSMMVESVRLVLQRWRGVCSFSQTMRSSWSDEESHLVYGHCSKNEVDLENDYAQIKLKDSEI